MRHVHPEDLHEAGIGDQLAEQNALAAAKVHHRTGALGLERRDDRSPAKNCQWCRFLFLILRKISGDGVVECLRFGIVDLGDTANGRLHEFPAMGQIAPGDQITVRVPREPRPTRA